MRLDAYLTDRDSTHSSGENLEYDPIFTTLQLSAQPGEEKQAGKEILAATDPDYRAVTANALAVLERSHDIRAAAHLAMAQLRLNGLEGFEGPVAYVRALLQDRWETCHPQLDPDDDNDPTMRITAVMGLADANTVLRALRLAPLAQSPTLGRFTLRDLAVVEGEIAKPPEMTEIPSAQVVEAMFRDTPADVLRARLDAARNLFLDVQAINKVFLERTPGDGPDLETLIRYLRKAVGRLAAAVGEPDMPAPPPEEEELVVAEAADEAAPAAEAPMARRERSGEITTSADVEAALKLIIAYYDRYEPSSPVPILLKRAQRLVGADFMTILQDMAPQGIDSVRVLGGLE